MQHRTIGNDVVGRVTTSAIGLGAMPLSITPQRPSPEAAEAVVHAALDAGVRLVDTADAYCLDATEMGHNERTVAAAVRSWGGSDDVLIATKGGHTREGKEWGLDGSPAYLRRACDASLQALGVDAIGLYQFHRPDPQTPWAESMGALKDLYDAGKVRMVGVSNATVAQIDEARAICGDAFVSVQNEFSPGFRSSADELAHCAAHGIAWFPWSPFGGMGGAGSLAETAAEFAAVAEELDVSVYQVTLAWHLAQADVVIPIPGASKPRSIIDSAAATHVRLSDEQLARLNTTP
ncbi:Predicted oxidoreductase [Klenkia marina]|uniref:Predicted oxidoreductase n=1 Tax=Klenkia marina TaxID=1960309 RepID=A0A1G4YDB8_9ACTN|nr:aldo/keto reductase [Klenkia marina]SCX50748.1 Predicted oxidoreductase [Klenkia marina]